jgi:hypothetical protein
VVEPSSIDRPRSSFLVTEKTPLCETGGRRPWSSGTLFTASIKQNDIAWLTLFQQPII